MLIIALVTVAAFTNGADAAHRRELRQGERTLQSQPEVNVYNVMEALVDEWCRDQLGQTCHDRCYCSDIDFSAQTVMWSRFFYNKPIVNYTMLWGPLNMDEPKAIKSTTQAINYCQAKDFEYECSTRTKVFEQQATSKISSKTLTFGGSVKGTAVMGASLVPPTAMRGFTLGFSGSYSETEQTTKTSTNQKSNMNMMTIKMPSNKSRCAKITTTVNKLYAPGTAKVAYNVSNWVVVKTPCYGWIWDTEPSSPFRTPMVSDGKGNCFRAFTFPHLVKEAKRYGTPGHQDWTLINDYTASISYTATIEADMVTDGYSTVDSLPPDDPDCLAYGGQQTQIGTKKNTQTGKEIPVWQAAMVE